MQDSGVRTTATSAFEVRLKVGVGAKKKKKTILKKILKKSKKC